MSRHAVLRPLYRAGTNTGTWLEKAVDPGIRWAKEVLSVDTGWPDHGSVVRCCIGFVASMTKRPDEVLK